MLEAYPNNTILSESTNNFSHPVKVIHLVGSLSSNITHEFVVESLLHLLHAARDLATREIDFMYNEDLQGLADDLSVDILYLERSLEGSDAS